MELKIFTTVVLSLTQLPLQCRASPRPWPKLSWVKHLGHQGHWYGQKREVDAVRVDDTYIPISSPFGNSFLPLSDSEAANVTEFLHHDESLNLTRALNATRYGRFMEPIHNWY